MNPLRRRCCFWLAAAAVAAGPVAAQVNASERGRIDRLIAYVAAQKDMQFIRNGTAYTCADAAEFLRKKFDSMGDNVTSARQFIDQIATKSSMSGEPYLIRFADGRTAMAAHLLHAELKRMER